MLATADEQKRGCTVLQGDGGGAGQPVHVRGCVREKGTVSSAIWQHQRTREDGGDRRIMPAGQGRR